MNQIGGNIWRDICDGTALINPEHSLSKFGLLVYADLKRYKFVYFFTFPALNYPLDVQFKLQQHPKDGTKTLYLPIIDVISEQSILKLQNEYDKTDTDRCFQRGFFIVKHIRYPGDCIDDVEMLPLNRYHDALESAGGKIDVYFAFNDPSSNDLYPGWPLRNYLCLIAVKYRLTNVKLIRIRSGSITGESKSRFQHSSIFEISCELNHGSLGDINDQSKMPSLSGWERNEHQQLAPKQVDLSSLLNPERLAEDAVNLNLRLMKWRLLPNLDLDRISSTKCLLLGCGALGSHIARGLLAWGIKDLTLVDNSRISYSNPVRQILYTFEDCSKGTQVYKADAAAANLKKIHPTINVRPYKFSIPMPGHQISERELEQTKLDVLTLENLIEESDVVFLLMDTRESRWLPTVIGLAKQKLVINAAIGFDTFLLQRHGVRDYKDGVSSETNSILDNSDRQREDRLPADQLGCYFCNDIVAPGDSTIDRTLDQQCTVSRPGVSMVVSALAIELLASILSSPLGPRTPAPQNVQNDTSLITDEDCDSELGLVPHSVRGSLSRYHIYLPTSPCFNKCSACSEAVVRSYMEFGFDFLQKVFNDPNHLEDVAGLKDLQNFNETVWTLDSGDEDDV